MGKKNDERAEKIGKLAEIWYQANADKNAAQNLEKKTQETLAIELANEGELFTHKLSNGSFLQLGFVDDEKEEIDPKKMLEKHPELFWQLVSVPKTAVAQKLGDKEVAVLSRVVKVNSFKIKKHKTDPR